jgi:hypothetical protein
MWHPPTGRDFHAPLWRIGVMKVAALALVALSAVVAIPAATAKDFRPGDLRLCNSTRCVAVVNRQVLPLVGSFYYGNGRLVQARRPKLGAPYYELRFRNGYATAIIATRRLDRFLSYGVNTGRFARNAWYTAPKTLAREFRRLAARVRPLRLTRAALAKSR